MKLELLKSEFSVSCATFYVTGDELSSRSVFPHLSVFGFRSLMFTLLHSELLSLACHFVATWGHAHLSCGGKAVVAEVLWGPGLGSGCVAWAQSQVARQVGDNTPNLSCQGAEGWGRVGTFRILEGGTQWKLHSSILIFLPRLFVLNQVLPKWKTSEFFCKLYSPICCFKKICLCFDKPPSNHGSLSVGGVSHRILTYLRTLISLTVCHSLPKLIWALPGLCCFLLVWGPLLPVSKMLQMLAVDVVEEVNNP